MRETVMSYTKAELAQTRAELAQQRRELAQVRRELHDERVRRDEWKKMYDQAVAGAEIERLQAELAQARTELAVIGDLAQRKQSRMHECAYCGYRYPLKSTLTEHIESCPEHPLAKVKAELTKAVAQVAAITLAVERLWGFWDGNALVAKPGYEDDIREAWDRLLVARDAGVAAKLLERLADYACQAAKAAKGSPDDVDEAYNDEEITRALAACIREALALEANNES